MTKKEKLNASKEKPSADPSDEKLEGGSAKLKCGPLKPLFKVGGRVSAARWPDKISRRKNQNVSWHRGTIKAFREVASKSPYGPRRFYDIEYDDGGELRGVVDYFVFSALDHALIERNHGKSKWIGVRNICDTDTGDSWARIVGWYVAAIDGKERTYTYLSEAMDAYDRSVLKGAKRKGRKVKQFELNRPEQYPPDQYPDLFEDFNPDGDGEEGGAEGTSERNSAGLEDELFPCADKPASAARTPPASYDAMPKIAEALNTDSTSKFEAGASAKSNSRRSIASRKRSSCQSPDGSSFDPSSRIAGDSSPGDVNSPGTSSNPPLDAGRSLSSQGAKAVSPESVPRRSTRERRANGNSNCNLAVYHAAAASDRSLEIAGGLLRRDTNTVKTSACSNPMDTGFSSPSQGASEVSPVRYRNPRRNQRKRHTNTQNGRDNQEYVFAYPLSTKIELQSEHLDTKKSSGKDRSKVFAYPLSAKIELQSEHLDAKKSSRENRSKVFVDPMSAEIELQSEHLDTKKKSSGKDCNEVFVYPMSAEIELQSEHLDTKKSSGEDRNEVFVYSLSAEIELQSEHLDIKKSSGENRNAGPGQSQRKRVSETQPSETAAAVKARKRMRKGGLPQKAKVHSQRRKRSK